MLVASVLISIASSTHYHNQTHVAYVVCGFEEPDIGADDIVRGLLGFWIHMLIALGFGLLWFYFIQYAPDRTWCWQYIYSDMCGSARENCPPFGSAL